MNPNEPKDTQLKKIKDTSSSLKKTNQKKSIYPEGTRHTAHNLSGLDKVMSLSFEEHIGDEILFANEMPRAVPWSVAWADVMMTMFVIFAALYLFKAPIKEMEVPQQELRTEYSNREGNYPWDASDIQSPKEQSIQEIYDVSRQTLSSASSVELVSDKAVRIILRSDLLFDMGKVYIKEDAKASLKEVAEVLRHNEYMVNVVGHTDDLPINTEEFPSNWELSTARACQVARFLMEDMDIPEEKFYVTGHSFYQPVKPNTNDMNRAANRRVEIIITKERPYGIKQDIENKIIS